MSTTACADTEERSEINAAAAESTPTPDATVASDPVGSDPSPVPAESIFDKAPTGYKYVRSAAAQERFESQMRKVFASPPPGLALDSVALRRVVKTDGSVAGSLLIISVDLEDVATTPSFQQGLLGGFDEIREIEIAGAPAFFAEDFTPNGQEVIVFFHEGTVAVEVFGVTSVEVKKLAEAVAQAL